MAGVKALRKIQLGQESVAGTAVPATAMWAGTGMPQDLREMKWVKEDIGHLLGRNRTYFARTLAAMTFEQTEATFEQLPYLLSAGVENVLAGAADGSGSGKIYQYDVSDASANTIQTYTIEAGDNEGMEEMEYAFLTALRLSGKAGEAVMMAGDWTGRQLTATSFTAGLTPPSVEEILFQKGKLYIDLASGNLGTTQKTSTFLEFNLELKTGYVPVFTGDGNLHFTFHKMTMPELTCRVVFEHDATSIAEKVNWRAETALQVKLLFEGSTFAQAGTTYSKKTLIVNLPGLWDNFAKIDERDGNDIVEGTFRSVYVSNADVTAPQFIVVVDAASLA